MKVRKNCKKRVEERGIGGINPNADKTIFNPNWGIDTNTYISPVKYPNTKVIRTALNVYQAELRKPVHVAFCLDYSGSMYGQGVKQLKSAMDYILTEKAQVDLLQFSEKDKIDVIPFSSKVLAKWETTNGKETKQILNKISKTTPNGQTALYDAVIEALEMLKDEDMEKYNSSIILMTDGQANVGKYSDLYKVYKQIKKEIPIYSIMFGDAVVDELTPIATLTNGKVFDGKIDLVKAFKEVRGYN